MMGSTIMRKTKKSRMSLLATGIALAIPTFAQEKPMEHEHHGGFMQGSMHHAVAKGVALQTKTDAASHTITLREGPLTLPANTDHMKMPQPPDVFWTIPLDAFLRAYTPRLVDANGNAVPGTALHHTAFWNTNRSDFLCP